MDKNTRNDIQRATQAARNLLERAFSERLEGTYDILLDGTIAEQLGSHLSDRQKVIREKLVAAVSHKRSTGLKAKEAVDTYLREAAFTTLNRFVALKMLEARQLVQECVSKGEDSSGFKEFTALAPGLAAVEDKGYRLYIETLFDEIGQEINILFDRRDAASLLWPDRQTLLELLGILNAPELASVWSEDETIGWVYQYFNGDEERTKMRAESQAPRNSRELAVRNQFFTPRYVVQFLTDNTLGRAWYEMMQGETRLAHLDYLVRRQNEVFLADGEQVPVVEIDDSELSQEELLQQTVYVPFRVKKDPRDLRILDPACGSGHFLLYAFELLVSIYEEAWNDISAATFTETGTKLRADYDRIDKLRRAMPELILRHNLHGVDIDPRATQIAALALWMRAHRAYNVFEVGRADRPPIAKTNIVVAEPMPGDTELVDEFAASLKPTVLGDLFKTMVEEMKLAGELGSLLKIEESIAKAVKEAEESHRQGSLFDGELESKDFWDTADEKIIAALGSFAESAAGSTGIRRQLFAGDAAQGVAFIELMRKRFDAVLMNPPFGDPPRAYTPRLGLNYLAIKHDLASAFLERGTELSNEKGTVGAIVTRTLFFLTYLRQWRQKYLFENTRIGLFADLGFGVLDAMVETAAICIQQKRHGAALDSTFITANDPITRHIKLKGLPFDDDLPLVALRQEHLTRIPGSPLAFRVPKSVLNLFDNGSGIESEEAGAFTGALTQDDFRFTRLWWEPPSSTEGRGWATTNDTLWVPYVSGGSHHPIYADLKLLVNWTSDGEELKAYLTAYRASKGFADQWTGQLNSYKRYFVSGAVWSLRPLNQGCFWILPSGCIFGNNAPALQTSRAEDVLSLCALMNTTPFRAILGLLMPRGNTGTATLKYNLGYVRAVPIPTLSAAQKELLERSATAAWQLLRQLDAMNETSHAFQGVLAKRHKAEELAADLRSNLISHLHAIEECGNEAFGVQQEEMKALSNATGVTSCADNLGMNPIIQYALDQSYEKRSVHFALGHALGRWPHEPVSCGRQCDAGSPFDPIPIIPRYTNADSNFGGILVEDKGHRDDFATALRRSLKTTLGDEIQAQEIPLTGLFKEHLRFYSHGKRKAPIYWQLATASASYSVWCYYHRLTRDTFFRVANDYVTPKVDHEDRKLDRLRQEAGAEPSTQQLKVIDAQETFVAELRAFLTEVKRIAPLWNPNLNDGVIINFAPLWRLAPQHKPWQKECKKVWDSLVNGNYDWSHLAMHLWPERVVPRCKDDRSLAIAHGLEDDFWYADDDGKWQERKVSSTRIDELVAERSSAAVKAALENLLEAPAAVGQNRRKRRAKV